MGTGGRSPEPDMPTEDRDRRTVMVMQLAAKVTPKELEEFFQKVGQVNKRMVVVLCVEGSISLVGPGLLYCR